MQVEPPVTLYRLKSRDGQIFLADRRTLAMIGPVENLFINAGLDYVPPETLHPIQLEISAIVMRKVIEWCDHHKNDAPMEQEGDIPDWDANFLTVRHSLLFDIIRAARDFEVPGLFAMCCRVVEQNPREILAGLVERDDDEPQIFTNTAAAAA